MKFLCERCGVVRELGAFRVEGETLVLTCAGCGAETRGEGLAPSGVAATGSAKLRVIPFRAGPDPAKLAALAARKGPFDAPPDRCPKCIAQRDPAGLACPQCGFVYVNFEPTSMEPSQALGDAWRAVLESWDDPVMHERFFRQSEAEDALATAGRLYRIRLESAPEDPVAARGRDEVLRRAALPPTLATQKRGFGSRPPAWQFILLGVLVLFAALAMLSLLHQTLR